ncbi:hypothetical protein P9112_003821 [Eukaryota sp. TZLM1-RC]
MHFIINDPLPNLPERIVSGKSLLHFIILHNNGLLWPTNLLPRRILSLVLMKKKLLIQSTPALLLKVIYVLFSTFLKEVKTYHLTSI